MRISLGDHRLDTFCEWMLGSPELVVTLRRLLAASEDIKAEFGRVHLAECRAKSIAAGFGQNTAALPSATSGCAIGQPGATPW